MPTRSRKRSPPATRRRALELLEASIDGCTEAIMLAYGFKTELLVELAPDRSHPHADYRGWPAGAHEASMALILKRADRSRMSALGHSRPMRSEPREHVCPLLPESGQLADGLGMSASCQLWTKQIDPSGVCFPAALGIAPRRRGVRHD